jgi:hypothetical protein
MYAPHLGARVTASIFRVLALLVLIVGGIITYTYPRYLHVHFGASVSQCVYLGIGLGFATAIFASVPAFFGYVLDLLIQNELNTRETAYNVYRGTAPSPPKRHV